MSAKRQRMTWAALDREAAAPPATPGYGVEDQDHPAHTQDDPGSEPYIIGDPSAFGEDVHKPPYGDSGAPATPGYGVEDQDHPAHQGQVGRQANLMGLVRKKAAKALKLAQATLGKRANWAAIEDQAFNFMSMEDAALDASLGRLSGGFLADDPPRFSDDIDLDLGAADEDDGMETDADPVMARLKAMEEEISALKRGGRRADQNDPKGPTLGTSGKSEQEEKKDETAVSNKAARVKLARLFIACDLDNDGFVTKEDWMGPPAVFAALDQDRDGIIAKHEVLAGEVPEAFKKQWDKGDDKDDEKSEKKDDEKSEKKDDEKSEKKDDKESGKKAGKKSDDEEPAEDEAKESDKKAGKKSEDEEPKDDKESAKKSSKKSEDEEDAKEPTKESAKKSDKQAFGYLADFDEDELEMLSAMNYGLENDEVPEGETACGEMMGGKTAEEEEAPEDEAEEADKEASFFSTGYDPMGLADGTNLTAADKAAFEEVFGKQAEDEEAKEDDEDDEVTEKEANKRLASLLRPQPRKASTGVRSVGTVGKTASGRNEVAELSNLWASDPDVSGSFT